MFFLKKVRQRLINGDSPSKSTDKFRKYIIYTIGEIFLVVIGILIALQVNNQNEETNIYKKQENHLLLIRGEMINNRKALANEKADLLFIIESNRKILDLMNSSHAIDSISESELSALLIRPISREIEVNYESGALTELISSGGLKDIQNDRIRSILASWAGKLADLRLQEKALRESLSKSSDYVEGHGNFRVIFDKIGLSAYLKIKESTNTSTNKNLLYSHRFENILLKYLALANNLYEKEYPVYQHDLTLLIDLINDEMGLEDEE